MLHTQVKDESNGIGDAFLLSGEGPGMIKDQAAMERYMAETPGTLQGEGGKSEAGLLYGRIVARQNRLLT